LFSYYKANPGVPAGISGDKVFPYFIVNGLPAGLTGLLIASVVCRRNEHGIHEHQQLSNDHPQRLYEKTCFR